MIFLLVLLFCSVYIFLIITVYIGLIGLPGGALFQVGLLNDVLIGVMYDAFDVRVVQAARTKVYCAHCIPYNGSHQA